MKLRLAASVSVVQCDDCDGIHLQFLDAKGKAFAEAVLDEELLFGITNSLMEVCDDLGGELAMEDTIGECVGSA